MTDANEDHGRAVRAARQLVHTDLLLGASSVPFGSSRITVATEVVAPESTETESEAALSGGKEERLAALLEKHNRECPLVETMPGYTNIVFGEGDPNARLMFVGEAPGAEEDRTGRPFVGRAGQLLNKMIEAMGLRREDVYIANVLKVRPPNNATPTPEQVDQSAPFLVEQIEIISPEVIVTLGAPSAKFLLQTREGITRLRGRWHKAALPDLDIDVMPTFHPAYLLRQYTEENRKKVWSDLQQVMKRLSRG